jgi:serine/threonine protein kinase
LLGKYELTGMLGKGGMGEVWEGEHTLTGRRVAVKILADNYLSNRKVVARFGREARAASSINHPGIVEILDQDNTPDGTPFLVMEFLEGESVGERIRKQGKLSQDEALAIMLPLLDALDAAHQAGIIHRDLKPDNALILPGQRGDERIKILDFGISQKADEIEHHLTQEGSVLGTPHYMSPEQARGEVGIDGRADVYAAGVMFYECIVGDVPFDAGNYNALLQIILGTPPPSPRSRGADISIAIEQVLLAAMDKKRDRRPPSARAFHDLLLEASVTEDDAFLDIQTWTFSTPSEPPPPVEFGDDDLDEPAPPTSRKKTPVGMEDAGRQAPRVPAPPSKGAARTAQPAPRGSRTGENVVYTQPADFADPGDLEADLFANAPRAANGYDTPRSVPPPPSRSPFDPQPGAGFDAKPAARGGFDGPAGARPQGFEAAPGRSAPFDAAPRFDGSQRPAARPRGVAQPYMEPAGSSPDDSSLAKTVGNWVMALLAIGALVYLMQVVFTRPDRRKKQDNSTQAATPSTEDSQAGRNNP